MASVSWTINNLERDIATGAVLIAYWTAFAVEELEDGTRYTSATSGAVGFDPTPESEIFVPYEELTEHMMMTWMQLALGEERIQKVESDLLNEIYLQMHPSTALGMPWAVPVAPAPTDQVVPPVPPVQILTGPTGPAPE